MNLERDLYLAKLRPGSKVTISRACGDVEGVVLEVLPEGFLVEYELGGFVKELFERYAGVSKSNPERRLLTTLDFEARDRVRSFARLLDTERARDERYEGPRLRLRQIQVGKKR